VAKEINLLGAKRHHPFGVSVNVVLFIPEERVLLPTVKRLSGLKEANLYLPRGLTSLCLKLIGLFYPLP